MSPATGRQRRKRPLLTLKKTASSSSGSPPRPLSEDDRLVQGMRPAWAFDVYFDQVEEEGFTSHSRVIFRKGDDVILHSSYDETADVWIGRIHKIYTNPKALKNTLVKVQWYWSRNDIAEKRSRSFDPSHCAPFERLLSDHFDIVTAYSLEAVTHVHEYDETSLDPPRIGPRDLFVRARYQRRRCTIKPPLGSQTCICQVPYNPFPTPPSSAVTGADDDVIMTSGPPDDDLDVMHFCPSMKCRKWYHRSCLLTKQQACVSLPADAQDPKGTLMDSLPAQTRGLRLLAVSPDDEVLFTTFEYFYEQESQQEHIFSDTVSLPAAFRMLDLPDPEGIVAHLPPGLCAIAQSPIVRYPNGPNEFAIGNVSDVVLARRFVYAAVQHHSPPVASPRFRDLLMWVLLQETEQEKRLFTGTKSAEDECAYIAFLEDLCRELEEFGLLASPRPSYWEAKSREYAAMEGLLSGTAFLCPQCRGAI